MLKSVVVASVLLLASLGAACGSPPGPTPPTRVPGPSPAGVAAPGQASPSSSPMPIPPGDATPSPTADLGGASESPTTPTASQPFTKLNADEATRDELLKIPNVNERIADAILEDRPHASIVHFRRKLSAYASPAQIAEYERYLYLPVWTHFADTETLRQLPGVDIAIARELALGRPYASVEDFLQKLGEYVTTDQVAAARPYVVSP